MAFNNGYKLAIWHYFYTNFVGYAVASNKRVSGSFPAKWVDLSLSMQYTIFVILLAYSILILNALNKKRKTQLCLFWKQNTIRKEIIKIMNNVHLSILYY